MVNNTSTLSNVFTGETVNNLSNQIDDLKQMVQDDLAKGISLIYPSLVENLEVNVLPEHIFKGYFLPGFLGQNPNKSWLAQWIGIAGSPSAEVSVIDSAQRELFRVPPILLSKDVLFRASRHEIGHIVQHSVKLQNTLQGKDTYLYQSMANKAREVSSPSMNGAIARWREIFSRYGVNVDIPSAAANAESGSDDMFEY
jgi:hypothetical protein